MIIQKRMKKMKIFKQTPGYCGPTSLRTVLNYYGLKYSEEYLAKLVGATRENGSDPWQIVEAAKKLGLKAYYKTNSKVKDLKELLKKNIPVIVDWSPKKGLGHYSIVLNVDRNNITIGDPKTGKKINLSIKIFEEKWYEMYGNKKVRGEIIVIEKNNKESYRPAVFIVVYRINPETKEPEYILLKRKLHWVGWEFPKGGIDAGESSLQATKRETKEETALAPIKIMRYNVKGKYKYHKILKRRPGYIGQTYELFSASVKHKPPQKIKLDPKEHSAYVWLPFKQAIKKLTWPNQKKCLKIVNKTIK
jgi:8-oxo-dGTP pyrophosphatase MutT (NUDIX family)